MSEERPSYIGALAERIMNLVALVVTGLLCFNLIVLFLLVDSKIRAIVGVLAGAGTIWILVRKINHHDDPRRAKPPPDTP